ncbi:hypothetical protein D6387_26195 [Salmonella enterica subsp. enterica serovar Cerro]|nr:hypothetical protein [Salmonella enterica]EBY9434249.1 hypothetical protein [Salmonella enterica subsp. enterica serovar Cerro]
MTVAERRKIERYLNDKQKVEYHDVVVSAQTDALFSGLAIYYGFFREQMRIKNFLPGSGSRQ